jgi:hypothetical protein
MPTLSGATMPLMRQVFATQRQQAAPSDDGARPAASVSAKGTR